MRISFDCARAPPAARMLKAGRLAAAAPTKVRLFI
jgi:hypothetical protein